jgi:gamma-glutamyltranspeptidase/glutathione hydrolase
MAAGFPASSIAALNALGHRSNFGVTPPTPPTPVACTASIGSVQGVVIDLQTGKQYGGADQRREGTVIGLPRPGGKK